MLNGYIYSTCGDLDENHLPLSDNTDGIWKKVPLVHDADYDSTVNTLLRIVSPMYRRNITTQEEYRTKYTEAYTSNSNIASFMKKSEVNLKQSIEPRKSLNLIDLHPSADTPTLSDTESLISPLNDAQLLPSPLKEDQSLASPLNDNKTPASSLNDDQRLSTTSLSSPCEMEDSDYMLENSLIELNNISEETREENNIMSTLQNDSDIMVEESYTATEEISETFQSIPPLQSTSTVISHEAAVSTNLVEVSYQQKDVEGNKEQKSEENIISEPTPDSIDQMKDEISDMKEEIIISNINLSPKFVFPETQLLDKKGKPCIGIAFSGGGARSASCTLGQLRGLHRLGLIEKTRYFSSVSGSSWTLIPFLYGKDLSREEFLGNIPEIVDKDAINFPSKSKDVPIQNYGILDSISKKIGLTPKQNSHSDKHLSAQLSTISLGKNVFRNLWFRSDSFAIGLRKSLLTPFGCGTEKNYFSWCEEHVNDIQVRNSTTLKKEDFITYKDESDPYLIINACLLNRGQKSTIDTRAHMEFTPLYVGCSKLYKSGKFTSGGVSPTVGGSYIEPFLFNGTEYARTSENMVNLPKTTITHRLNLADIMASTSAAPALLTGGLHINFIFPRFKYWTPWGQDMNEKEPTVTKDIIEEKTVVTNDLIEEKTVVTNDPSKKKTKAMNDSLKVITTKRNQTLTNEYTIGDGGLLENTGLMGLLKRGVKNIIVFLNTKAQLFKDNMAPIPKDSSKPVLSIDDTIVSSDISEDLSLPFGPLHYIGFLRERQMRATAQKFTNYYPTKLKIFRGKLDYEINHVFEDEDGNNYTRLAKALLEKRMRGEPTMHEDEYNVLENDFYGIKGGWKVRVLWVYNDVYKDFEENHIEESLKKVLKLRQPNTEFARYPHYRTGNENPPSVARLAKEKVNLLSYQHTFNILDHKDTFLNFYTRAKEESTNVAST